MNDPILAVLLGLAAALTLLTGLLGLFAPRLMTRDPAQVKSKRLQFGFLAVVSALVLAGISTEERFVGWLLIGALFTGAAVLPREKLPWRLSVGAVLGALFLGGACWFGARELWQAVSGAQVLPEWSGWVQWPPAIALGAWLQHRYDEVLARLRVSPSRS